MAGLVSTTQAPTGPSSLGAELRLLVGLRRTIQSHNDSWKRPLGIALGVVAVAGTWAGVLLAAPGARADVVAVLLGMWAVGWVVGPILASGAGVLRPEYFTLLPLERRRLGLGLLVSVYVGPGALLTLAATLSLVAYGASLGASGGVGAVVGLAAALLFTIGLVAFSRVVYAVLGAAMRTQVGVEIAAVQYGLMIAAMMAGWLVLFPVGLAVPSLLADGLPEGERPTCCTRCRSGGPAVRSRRSRRSRPGSTAGPVRRVRCGASGRCSRGRRSPSPPPSHC
ncbi:hypothetical protein GCM10025875_26490 [Litorihabitans aurantiacus]|uniref:Uncharacterized protein n=1 Tax=Litorihabitans aurantiacus TaxID=1930061 RepID=A0AA37XG33_9MICO|nr:hypothetical protein GCM10025875_26490 [Litorihabitans aurantiacus]